MKYKAYKNIDLVQINLVPGQNEYYFPKNVDWADKVVNKIVLIQPEKELLSPIDGVTPVQKFTSGPYTNMYINLYDSEEHILTNNLQTGLISQNMDHPIYLNKKLSLKLSNIVFQDGVGDDASCLLFYIFWDAREIECAETRKSVTVEVPLLANEKKVFSDIINTYIHIQPHDIKSIVVWDEFEQQPAYITLRDHQLSYIFNSVYTGLMKPEVWSIAPLRNNKLRLDNMDVDFDYSFIRNARNSDISLRITFEY